MKALKVTFIVIVFVLLIAIGYLSLIYFRILPVSAPNTVTQTLNPIPKNSPVRASTYEGTISCLPTRFGDPYVEEEGCAFGIRLDSDLLYYALGGFNNLETLDPREGQKIRVTGTFETGFATHYAIRGRIIVTSYTLL